MVTVAESGVPIVPFPPLTDAIVTTVCFLHGEDQQ
jgi:hypothetical protein